MKRATILILALLLALPATAAIKWPPRSEHKLDNGLTVVLVPLPNVPKVTAELFFLTRHNALSQLAARVANEGTAARTSKELKEELRSIGGHLEIETDSDTTTVVASSLSDSAPRLFELLSDVVQHPSFPKDEVDLAKQNMAAEIEEQRSSPDFLAGERLQQALFGSHPYAYVVPDPAALSAITREQLRVFAAAHYVPNNAYLIVVGDLDASRTLSEVRKAFGSWKRVPVTAAQLPSPPKRERRQILFVDRPGSVQSVILFGLAAPPRRSSDYLALRTATSILGGGFASRLVHNLREAKGYTYTPSSLVDLRRDAGLFTASASVRNEVTGPALLEMLYEIDRMRVLPVDAEELGAAKAYSAGNLSLEMETQAGLARRIATIYSYNLARDFLDTFTDKLDALTPADIQRSAAKYFDTYRSAIVVVGDWSAVKDQVLPFGEVTVYDEAGKVKKPS